VRFTRRWRSLRQDQLTREDIRQVAQIETLGLLEAMTPILAERSGQQLIHSHLASEVGIAVDTVRRWIDVLERLHFGFVVRPWFTNVAKALHKEPKWFLREWLSDSLAYFKQATKARHAFQAVIEMPFVADDCFSRTDPVVVPCADIAQSVAVSAELDTARAQRVKRERPHRQKARLIRMHAIFGEHRFHAGFFVGQSRVIVYVHNMPARRIVL
jgi:hypothetical protein